MRPFTKALSILFPSKKTTMLSWENLLTSVKVVALSLVFLPVNTGFAQANSHPGLGIVQLRSALRPVYVLEPGEHYQAEIILANKSDVVVTVDLSLTDYMPTEQGSQYPAAGTLPRSNAPWITLENSTVEIPPETQVIVPYRIDLPADAKLVGTYWSMILVEPSNAVQEHLEVREINDGEVRTAIRQRFRYGISVVTTIAHSGQNQIDLGNPRLISIDGNPNSFHISLQNTGKTLVTPKVWLELFDMQGNPVGRHEAEPGRIFPGSSVRTQFPLGTLEPGDYQALVIADPGNDDIFGARYTLNITSENGN